MEISKRTFFACLLCLSGCLGAQSSELNDGYLMNLVLKCTKTEDVESCLKTKAVGFIDDLIRTKEPLVITEYLSLARDPNVSESDLQDIEGRGEEDWDKIVWSRLSALFKTRVPRLTLPSNILEGRSKEDKIFKKGHGIFLMAGMMGGMMMKMALAKIALIAGKALIVAKIALVLSLIIALKKIAGQGGGGGHSEVVYTSSEHGSGRKFTVDGSAHDLAYNAHR